MNGPTAACWLIPAVADKAYMVHVRLASVSGVAQLKTVLGCELRLLSQQCCSRKISLLRWATITGSAGHMRQGQHCPPPRSHRCDQSLIAAGTCICQQRAGHSQTALSANTEVVSAASRALCDQWTGHDHVAGAVVHTHRAVLRTGQGLG